MFRKMTEAEKILYRKAQEKASWENYKRWQLKNKKEIREGQLITSFDEFKLIYNNPDIGRRLSNIKEEVMYQTSSKSYQALKKQYKLIYDEPPDVKEFNRKKSTQELSEYLKDNIYKYRSELSQQGYNSTTINKMVSTYFFGS